MAFLHRTLGREGDLYFVANQKQETAEFVGEFRVSPAEQGHGKASGMKAQLWNPATGAVKDVECSFEDGTAKISFKLESLESVFVVFRRDKRNTGSVKKEGTEPEFIPFQIT